jgi:hypothetical protein
MGTTAARRLRPARPLFAQFFPLARDERFRHLSLQRQSFIEEAAEQHELFYRIARQQLGAGARDRAVGVGGERARLVGCRDHDLAPVLGVAAPMHQPAALQPVDERGDRRRRQGSLFGDGARGLRARADEAQAAAFGTVEVMQLPDRQAI